MSIDKLGMEENLFFASDYAASKPAMRLIKSDIACLGNKSALRSIDAFWCTNPLQKKQTVDVSETQVTVACYGQ